MICISHLQSLLLDERPTGLCVDQQKTMANWNTEDDPNLEGCQRKQKVILTTVGLLATHEEPIIYTWMKCT